MRDQRIIAIVIAALIIAVGAGVYIGYRWWHRDEEPAPVVQEERKTPLKRMANLPPKKALVEPPPPPEYAPDAPVLEQARKALREGVSPAKAVELAKALPDSPERADAAFLLLEYAADYGNAEAALLVAGYYDPTDDSPSGTIRKNPATAYEWYQAALADGRTEARERMRNLRLWVGMKAEQGSREARLLLQSWQ